MASSSPPISIHSPLTGRDPIVTASQARYTRFQSTLPSRGETHVLPGVGGGDVFQSTLPSRGETLQVTQNSNREGNFNPLSPHGERHLQRLFCFFTSEFQSTLPSRGETRMGNMVDTEGNNFNPLSPHGERPTGYIFLRYFRNFNPLSPHGERRNIYDNPELLKEDFNPLSPHGERR